MTTRSWLAVFLLILTFSSASSASTIIQVTFDEIVRSSEPAFEGRVIDHRAERDPNGSIHTYVTFQVLDATIPATAH